MNMLGVSSDGPTAAGKTTLGVSLASEYRGAFLDTGLTYRLLALGLAQGRLPLAVLESGDWVGRVEHRLGRFSAVVAVPEVVLLDGEDVSAGLWSHEVTGAIGSVTGNALIRSSIQTYHRDLLEPEVLVFVAGRDVATTLLSIASLHVFLTAALYARRERRRAQFRASPERSVAVDPPSSLDKDTFSAIVCRPNTLVLDTTHLPPTKVHARVRREIDGLHNS